MEWWGPHCQACLLWNHCRSKLWNPTCQEYCCCSTWQQQVSYCQCCQSIQDTVCCSIHLERRCLEVVLAVLLGRGRGVNKREVQYVMVVVRPTLVNNTCCDVTSRISMNSYLSHTSHLIFYVMWLVFQSCAHPTQKAFRGLPSNSCGSKSKDLVRTFHRGAFVSLIISHAMLVLQIYCHCHLVIHPKQCPISSQQPSPQDY